MNIYYPTAKAINKIYIKENRIQKKTVRCVTSSNSTEDYNAALAPER